MAQLRFSNRIQDVAESAIKTVIHLYKPGVANMAHGMVHWHPPEEALKSISNSINNDNSIHKYGPIEGRDNLRKILKEKIEKENKIDCSNKEIMVTAGGNQAFDNIVLTLCDPGDEVIIFHPYYFNHLMAIQLAKAIPVICPTTSEYIPELDNITFTSKTKMLVIVNPSNPSGAVIPEEKIKQLQKKCEEAGVWLISDEAYEYFIFDDAKHYSPVGDNVINIYSLSKSYGMAGWRIGYILMPKSVKPHIDKVQDTVVINPSQPGQLLAITLLQQFGGNWVKQQVAALTKQREIVWDALQQLNPIRTKGAFYFFAKLPNKYALQELKVATFLAEKYGVWVLIGGNFGASGYIRVSFGNLSVEDCKIASERLKTGIAAILNNEVDSFDFENKLF